MSQSSYDRCNLPDDFGVAAIAKLLSQLNVLSVRVHDKHAVFRSTRSAEVRSVAFEYRVDGLLPEREGSGVDRFLSAAVDTHQKAIGKVWMKRIPYSSDPKQAAQRRRL